MHEHEKFVYTYMCMCYTVLLNEFANVVSLAYNAFCQVLKCLAMNLKIFFSTCVILLLIIASGFVLCLIFFFLICLFVYLFVYLFMIYLFILLLLFCFPPQLVDSGLLLCL